MIKVVCFQIRTYSKGSQQYVKLCHKILGLLINLNNNTFESEIKRRRIGGKMI